MTDDNVIDLAQNRKKKSSKNGEEKPTKAALFKTIAKGLNGELPIGFDVKYHPIQVDGVRLVVKQLDDDGLVEFSSRDDVARQILQKMPTSAGLIWRNAQEAADYWLNDSPAQSMPPFFRWKSDPGLTFNRLPFDLKKEEDIQPAPLFDEFLERCTNADALLLWIGSLFEEASDLQTYVWMFGTGQNGKGALVRLLARIWGNGYRSKRAPHPDDKHWTAGLVGTRLIAFPDCNNYGFPASGLFKSLTGGDQQDINPKYQPAYTAKLPCKFIFLSNELPALSSEKADMRRAIFCEVQPIPGDVDPTYEERLWAEASDVISAAIIAYRGTCPKHEVIKSNNDSLDDWISVMEEPFDTVYEKWFVHYLHSETASAKRPEYVVPAQMQEILREEFKERSKQLAFIAHLRRVYGVKKTQIRLKDDKREWFYVGIKIKENKSSF